MDLFIKSSKYDNIYFSREVSARFRESVEYVYPYFKDRAEYSPDKNIVIIPSKTDYLLDCLGVVYDSVGVLTYNINYTSCLAAYAMFYTPSLNKGKYNSHENVAVYGSDYAFFIYKALSVIPRNVLVNASDIPGFERFPYVIITDEQFEYLQECAKNFCTLRFSDRVNCRELTVYPSVYVNKDDMLEKILSKFPAPLITEINPNYKVTFTENAIFNITKHSTSLETIIKSASVAYFDLYMHGITAEDNGNGKPLHHFNFEHKYKLSGHVGYMLFVVFIRRTEFEIEYAGERRTDKLMNTAKLLFSG